MKIANLLFFFFIFNFSLFAEGKVDEWLDKGNLFFEQENYTKAIEAFTNVLKTNPKNIEAYFMRGNAYYNISKFDNSISDYTSVFEYKS